MKRAGQIREQSSSGFVELSSSCMEEVLAPAGRLRRNTTLTVRSIAARLHMGTRKSLNAKPRWWRIGSNEFKL